MSTELNFLVKSCRSIDENGSMIWSVYHSKLSILYYFNDENIDLEKRLNVLMTMPVNLILIKWVRNCFLK